VYILQEAVNWDYSQFRPSIPLPTKLFVCFLVVSCFWAAIPLIKSIWISSRWPSAKRGKLVDLQRALEAGDLKSAATIASSLPNNSPESEIGELHAQISSAQLHALILKSDLAFRAAISGLLATTTNLKNFTLLLLLSSAAWTAYQVTNVFQFISENKATGISAVFGSLRETSALFCVGLILATAFHLIRWRLSSVLTCRQAQWGSIKGHLELISTRSL
jgi:hypothetical protein